jgi:arylsulfatase A-like enzyme
MRNGRRTEPPGRASTDRGPGPTYCQKNVCTTPRSPRPTIRSGACSRNSSGAFLDHAVVIVTSDHGEEFFEHGGKSHGRTLYEESVDVPLIIIGPGVPAGRRVAVNVSLVDLAPTLLDLLKLPPEPRFEGRSLLPRLAAESPPSGGADVLLELEKKVPPRFENRAHTRGLVRGSDKLLVERVAERSEFYDLGADPGETQRDPPGSSGRSAALRHALGELRAHLDERAAAAQTPKPLDEKSRERLKALGYAP